MNSAHGPTLESAGAWLVGTLDDDEQLRRRLVMRQSLLLELLREMRVAIDRGPSERVAALLEEFRRVREDQVQDRSLFLAGYAEACSPRDAVRCSALRDMCRVFGRYTAITGRFVRTYLRIGNEDLRDPDTFGKDIENLCETILRHTEYAELILYPLYRNRGGDPHPAPPLADTGSMHRHMPFAY